jgi:uncharacterized RDD family membrane protein YckC
MIAINNFSKDNVGFGKRALALIIDLMIINLIIIYPFRKMFTKYFGSITLAQNFNINDINKIVIPAAAYWAIFIISILALLYLTFFDYYLGQTPGKMLMKIKVISIKEENKQIGLMSALLRNCYILPFFPFYLFWVIEPIYLGFYKERFLERITFTKTIYENNFKNDIIIKHKNSRHIEEYKLEKVK